jgi:hypothetical protein
MLSAIPGPATTQEANDPRNGDGRAGATGLIDPEGVPRPSVTAWELAEPIRLDGALDEPAWRLADSAYGFTQNLPRAGLASTERSVVRVLFDESTLYVGAMLYDSDPQNGLTIPGLEQDFPTEDSDIFGVAIDTYLDRQNAFLFAVNPAGGLFDAQNFNDSRYTNRAWEGVVKVRTRILSNGWSVEMAIPFTTLRFKPVGEDQSWGINFVRRVRRRAEDSYWAPLTRQHRVHKMSRAGTLTGLRNLRQGRNLTLKPFVKTGRVDTDLLAGEPGNDFDVGFDAKYGVTSRMTIDLTVLTDFSQVEVDEEQVNLTRFSLFFPEKRDFFLENDGVFSLGDVSVRNYRTGSSSRDFRLFHSRRIGLSDDRRPLPIGAGARLTGRAGEFEVGLLNMQTRRDDDTPAENYTVARLRRNLFGNSDAGIMFVNRQGTSTGFTDSFNRSFGADANFQIARNMLLSTYYARTEEPGATGDRNAGYLQAAWRDPLLNTSVMLKHVGEEFNPGVGFVQRRGIRQAFATFGLHPQTSVSFLQEVNPYVDVNVIADPSWDLETREITGGFRTTFADGGTLSLEYRNTFDKLNTETDIAGRPVAAGEYRFNGGSVRYQSSGARDVSGSVSVSHGSFYDGRRTSISGATTLRPDYHLRIILSAQHNDLQLSGTEFTADLFAAQVRAAFSTILFASAFVQYNRDADELVSNIRLNYLHAPLSDFFLVFTERRDLLSHVLVERGVTVKLTKLFGF